MRIFPVLPSLHSLFFRIGVQEDVGYNGILQPTESTCGNTMNWYSVVTWISRGKSQPLNVQSELLQPNLFQRDAMTLKTGFFLKSFSIVTRQLQSPGRNKLFLYRGILDRMEKYAQSSWNVDCCRCFEKKILIILQISVTCGMILTDTIIWLMYTELHFRVNIL